MHIIFDTRSTNDDYYGDCDCAVVELTLRLAEQIHSRVTVAQQAHQQDNDLYELYFWDSTAEFYDYELLEACQEAVASRSSDEAGQDWAKSLDEIGYAVVPEEVDLTRHTPQRTECDQMIIRCSPRPSWCQPEFEVCWTASPKHSDIYVTTLELPVTEMDKLLTDNNPPILENQRHEG